jgi:hypothetical protein
MAQHSTPDSIEPAPSGGPERPGVHIHDSPESTGPARLSLVPLYPLLASVYPVLTLAGGNALEWLDVSELLSPLLISLGVAITLLVAAAGLTKDPHKRMFLAGVGVVIFAAYGSVRDGLGDVTGHPAGEAFVLLGSYGIVTAVYTVRTRVSFAPLSRFLNIFTAILVTLSLTSIAYGRLKAPAVALPPPLPRPTSLPATRPTIYLIILDQYTGSSALRENFGYDNAPFEAALRSRGFFVPRASRPNYVQTRPSLASLLNWSYLDSVVARIGPSSLDWRPLGPWVEDNRAVSFLKSLGYEFVFMPSWYPPMTRNRNADLTVPAPGRIRSQIAISWARTTMWQPIAHLACSILGCADYDLPESAALQDWKFEQLGALAASAKPRFVFAHLILPHQPFVYQADCAPRSPPLEFTGPLNIVRAAYIAQIQCVNRKLIAMIDAIRRVAPSPPVILLQADHGNGQMEPNAMSLESPTPARVRERTDIFSAYAVPGASDSLWYDTITPINVLPAVFNQLFNLRLPRLPDRTYWSTYGAPFRFMRVR